MRGVGDMLARMFCFLRGYVCVIVKSNFIERFINICIRRNIYLWDIRHKSADEANMKMSIKAFLKIRPIAKKTHSVVKIRKKCGLPILLHRYKKRYFLLWGFVFAICFLFIMSQFVWSIEIVGNDRVSDERILQVLEQMGFRKGCYKRKFDARDLKNGALLELDELSWIWVDVRGSKATVSVNEKKQAPIIIDKNTPCDIIAMRSGVIKDMTIKEGQSSVQIGQTVMEGQLLISGVMKSERADARYTHAAGAVYARTWYESSGVYPLSKQIRTPSGKKTSRHSLYVGNMKLDFFTKKEIPHENYDTENKRHDLVIFGVYTGISWETACYNEVTVTYEPLSAEQSAENARAELESKIVPDTNDALLQSSDINYVAVDENNIRVTLTQEYVEQIGYEKKIDMFLSSDEEKKAN